MCSGKTVYVVISECGEYSDRDIWISGIFTSKDVAEKFITARLTVRNLWEIWLKRYIEVRKRLDLLKTRDVQRNFENEHQEALVLTGGEPEKENAERMTYKEIEIDEWIKYDSKNVI